MKKFYTVEIYYPNLSFFDTIWTNKKSALLYIKYEKLKNPKNKFKLKITVEKYLKF